jgi:hypothetical protein
MVYTGVKGRAHVCMPTLPAGGGEPNIGRTAVCPYTRIQPQGVGDGGNLEYKRGVAQVSRAPKG